MRPASPSASSLVDTDFGLSRWLTNRVPQGSGIRGNRPGNLADAGGRNRSAQDRLALRGGNGVGFAGLVPGWALDRLPEVSLWSFQHSSRGRTPQLGARDQECGHLGAAAEFRFQMAGGWAAALRGGRTATEQEYLEFLGCRRGLGYRPSRFVSSNPTGRLSTLLYVDLMGNAHSLWQVKNFQATWAIPSHHRKYVAIPAPTIGSNVWMVDNF